MAKKFTKKPLSEEKIKRAVEVTEQLHKEEITPAPKKESKPSQKRVSFNVRMPEHIYNSLSAESERTGISKSSIVYRALINFLEIK